MEEIHWRQKSRVKWLKEGDRNTKFFHKIASANRRNNWIGKIQIEGELSEDPSLIKEHILNFYCKLFEEEEAWRPKVDHLTVSRLDAAEARELETPFTEFEVSRAVKELNGDKAPGPDGWTLAFFQHCWDFLKDDIMQVFSEFYHSSSFVRSLNCTFIVLIPKKHSAVRVEDFRPISLVGALYKILAKVLANRLKVVMHSLISESQNAFVSGRQILDAILVANEVIDSSLKNKKSGLICKLDIEKAYDHVNWNFLFYLLKKMGCGDRWCSWIKWCITSASFSVMINGSPEGFFTASRGLRQGDPLSPFLFILVMEVLSRMIKRVEQEGLLKGIQVGSSEQDQFGISHLMFADDTIVFCGADRMQLGILRCTLLGFEAVSGLKVNLQKTEIIPIGDQDNMSELAAILNCKVDSLPSTYLGMPLGAKFKCKEVWESVLEKCKKRLSDWKLNYLSSGARVTLIKSVLSSLPTYYLSLFSAPASVLKELEKMQRDFLWGKHEKSTKYSLVAWEKVCASFKSGGVGIRKLVLQNEALLGKWLWRFSNEDSSLWKRMIISKYGEEVGGWISAQSSQPYGVSLWKGIRKIWPKFEGCISWQLGCGDRIRFWKQRWLDIGCLADVFPDIFSIAVDKDALVSDYYSSFGQNREWNIQLRRHVNDWELGNLCQLMELLNSVACVNISDALIWRETKDNIFNVGSFYNVLKGDEVDPFPWMKIWKSVAPHRVIFFAWCVTHGKVLTIDNLKRRGHAMVNRCPLCLGNEESIDHLFIHCPWITGVWSFVLSCFGVQTCTPNDIKSFLLQWWGQRLAKRQKDVWNLVPLCLFWIVWKERNKRIFDGEGSHVANVKGMLFKVLLSWVNVGKDM